MIKEITKSSGALAVEGERAIQEVQAMVVVAKRFPRDERQAQDKILKACTSVKFAEAALYAYPRGNTVVSGPTIRLLECCSQAWGNFRQGFTVLASDKEQSLVSAFAWDLETNVWDVKTFKVPHERHTRTGVYKLTDPRDIYELIANQAARRKRGCIEALIPADVLEAAINQCEITQARSAGEPAEQVDKLLAAFGELGITKKQIEDRLKHHVTSIQQAELVQLRRIYRTIRDGIAHPSEYFEMAQAKALEPPEEPEGPDWLWDSQPGPAVKLPRPGPRKSDELIDPYPPGLLGSLGAEQSPDKSVPAPPPSVPLKVQDLHVNALEERIASLGLNRDRVLQWVKKKWGWLKFEALTEPQYDELCGRLEEFTKK